ncbi:hypothetical protein TrLO_g490 [Triparma laevis f. longispina]|uniref:Mitochondrial carrier protein n=1 Tax=Triparma laevis f. longispina TaxID=1714387 RepID=A0A9W7F3P6_9STRA|nr:hypothetical protein TrLO_g490 [Triparma laevis f. longispina]
MWTRTTMNHQYKYGGDFKTSLNTLYLDGGIKRLYSGLPFALIQVPLTRFCDVLSNELATTFILSSVPLPLRSFAGSCVASSFRFILTPVDTLKSTLQVNGKEGLNEILEDFNVERLYRGGVGNAAASLVGHYPFFLTYNFLTDLIPEGARSVEGEGLLTFLAYRAAVGVGASAASDCVSNVLRILKTVRQTTEEDLTYKEVFDKLLEEEDGDLLKVWSRGLSTRVSINALQSGLFSVGWKYLQATSK